MSRTDAKTETFIVQAAGWIGGRRREAGEELRLTASQAKYLGARIALKANTSAKAAKG